MSVFKRGDVWHYDFTDSRGDRHRGSTRQRGKAAALKVEDRQRRRAELGEVSKPDLTLREAADRWFAARITDRRSAKTTAFRVEIMLRCMGGAALISQIDAATIEEAIQTRRLEPTRQGRAPTNATVNRDLIDSTLRPLLRYCRKVLGISVAEIDWGELRLAEPRQRSRAFTRAEMAAWRAALPSWYRPLFDFMATYGVRLREAFFAPAAYEPATWRITIRQRKNGKPHVVRLIDRDAPDMTARYGRAVDAKLPTVWFRETKAGIAPLTPRGFQNASRRALDASGLADARSAHDLRHHAATAFLRLPGATMLSLQRLLGHEHIASTARYSHVTEDDVWNTLRHTIGADADFEENSPIKSTTRTGT